MAYHCCEWRFTHTRYNGRNYVGTAHIPAFKPFTFTRYAYIHVICIQHVQHVSSVYRFWMRVEVHEITLCQSEIVNVSDWSAFVLFANREYRNLVLCSSVVSVHLECVNNKSFKKFSCDSDLVGILQLNDIRAMGKCKVFLQIYNFRLFLYVVCRMQCEQKGKKSKMNEMCDREEIAWPIVFNKRFTHRDQW